MGNNREGVIGKKGKKGKEREGYREKHNNSNNNKIF